MLRTKAETNDLGLCPSGLWDGGLGGVHSSAHTCSQPPPPSHFHRGRGPRCWGHGREQADLGSLCFCRDTDILWTRKWALSECYDINSTQRSWGWCGTAQAGWSGKGSRRWGRLTGGLMVTKTQPLKEEMS